MLVEEQAGGALALADTVVMELGPSSWAGPADEVDLARLTAAYLGVPPPDTGGESRPRSGDRTGGFGRVLTFASRRPMGTGLSTAPASGATDPGEGDS